MVTRKSRPRWHTWGGLTMRVNGVLWRWWRANRANITGHRKPAPPAKKRGRTQRERVVAWAHWGVKNTAQIHYTEAADRADWLHQPKAHLPLSTDCSGFATLCYRWAGAKDPNGLDYKTVGYTGTLLDHATKNGRIISVAEAKPGDLIVYGPGTGDHVALIVEPGPDPLTISHGDEAGPEYVRVSQDGRQPQRVCSTLP